MKIYTVITTYVFGAVDDVHTFALKDVAEAFVIEWANKNSPDIAPKFASSDEAIEWFAENDSKCEVGIDLFETEIETPLMDRDVNVIPTVVYLRLNNDLTIEQQNEFIESSLSGEEPFHLLGFESQLDNPAPGRLFNVVDMVEEDSFSIDIHSDVIVLYVQSHNEKIINRFTENLRTFLNAEFEVVREN